MRRVNLTDPETTIDPDDPPGHRAEMYRFGTELGARATGASLYVIAPGEGGSPYHYEHGEEEWLLVLEGRPSVRTPDGITELEPLDVVFFPTGPEGAHEIRNERDVPARVLMWSNLVVPTATSYPDSDKIGIWTGDPADDVIVPRSAAVGYWHGHPGVG
jgi:uncharacterized cupin superfamily protein